MSITNITVPSLVERNNGEHRVIFQCQNKACKALWTRMYTMYIQKRDRGYGRFVTDVSYEREEKGRRITCWEDGRIMPCSACQGVNIKVMPVRGIKSDQKCGSKCRNARRPDCECECAGANHGANH